MFGDIKSIAELAVRDWCRSIGLDMHYIKLGMDGNRGHDRGRYRQHAAAGI